VRWRIWRTVVQAGALVLPDRVQTAWAGRADEAHGVEVDELADHDLAEPHRGRAVGRELLQVNCALMPAVPSVRFRTE
jgi:hypothetical protein